MGIKNFFRKLKFVNNDTVYEIPLVGEEVAATRNSDNAEGTGEIFNDYYSNKAGYKAHAEGVLTKATGDYSHAEGNETQAAGFASHAEGCKTIASGNCAHAQGKETQAIGDCSVAFGSYNVPTYQGNQNYLLSVGNGSMDTSRSNAFALKENGEA